MCVHIGAEIARRTRLEGRSGEWRRWYEFSGLRIPSSYNPLLEHERKQQRRARIIGDLAAEASMPDWAVEWR